MSSGADREINICCHWFCEVRKSLGNIELILVTRPGTTFVALFGGADSLKENPGVWNQVQTGSWNVQAVGSINKGRLDGLIGHLFLGLCQSLCWRITREVFVDSRKIFFAVALPNGEAIGFLGRAGYGHGHTGFVSTHRGQV